MKLEIIGQNFKSMTEKEIMEEIYLRDQQIDELKEINKEHLSELSWLRELNKVLLRAYETLEKCFLQVIDIMKRGSN